MICGKDNQRLRNAIFSLRLIPFFIILFFPLKYSRAQIPTGADLSVQCNISDCSLGPLDCALTGGGGLSGSALFYEQNLLPGDTVGRNIIVQNNSVCTCESFLIDTKNELQSLHGAEGFATKLFTAINTGGTDLYGVTSGGNATSDKNLNNLFLAGPVNLGSVLIGETKTYNWLITFDAVADNGFQNAFSSFDFDMEFRCGTGGITTTSAATPSNDGKDGKDGNDNNDDNSDNSNPGAVAGTQTSIFAPLVVLQQGGDIAGTSVTAPSTENLPEIPAQTEEVGGVSSGECKDPPFWWLAFLIQGGIQALVFFLLKEKLVSLRKSFYITQAGLSVIAAVYFYTHFCPIWDVYLSILIGLLFEFFTVRRGKNLLQNVT